MPTFSEGFGPVSAQKIAAFERRFGIKLPADYKQFLRTTNGGIPDPNCFNVPDRGEALADYLYGVREERTYCDLEWEQRQASHWDPLPPGFVAIGHDPGGSTLLLATLGEDAGRVFFWDRSGLWVREDGHNTFPLAASFTAFIESLRELPEDSEPGAEADRPSD
jgi:hypothetical protein